MQGRFSSSKIIIINIATSTNAVHVLDCLKPSIKYILVGNVEYIHYSPMCHQGII